MDIKYSAAANDHILFYSWLNITLSPLLHLGLNEKSGLNYTRINVHLMTGFTVVSRFLPGLFVAHRNAIGAVAADHICSHTFLPSYSACYPGVYHFAPVRVCKCFELYLRAHACQHTPPPTFASSFLTDSLHSPVLFPPFSLTHTRLIIYVLPRKPSDSRCFHGILNFICRRINCTPTLSFILFFSCILGK